MKRNFWSRGLQWNKYCSRQRTKLACGMCNR